jgi:ketosteroid isomerase-like protein
MSQSANGHTEEEVRAVLDKYAAAIKAKDARATVALYASDAVGFELAPPLELESPALHDPSQIQQWFDTWKGPINSEGHDIEILVSEPIAYAYGLRHMTGVKVDGEQVDLWFRATACFKKEAGEWKIAHVHNSVPFAMDGSGRALLDLKPQS